MTPQRYDIVIIANQKTMSSENYEPKKIEAKWQKAWEQQGIYEAKDFSKKPKDYFLVEFPYPSGAGLHVGHCRSYTALDILARKRRMQGNNVLYPIGWDGFGLPSENYAIKTGIHPTITIKQSVATFTKQLKSMGFSFDWSREVNTTDPNYYKWTQWIFLKLFEQGLAYKAKIPINWCLSCKIGLANEEVIDGKCERCGGETEKRDKEQWLIKITEYADRLIDDLALVDFPERVKSQQINWIGKSEGHNIKFQIANFKSKSQNLNIDVFTTRIDTIFGCTYLVVAPEHEIILNIKSQIANFKEVEDYIKQTKKKSEIERQAENKEKTGVQLEGVMAVNPATGKEIPVFVADYVLTGYGTGAIMAVPAQDQRDYDFAKKYNLPISDIPNSWEMAEKGIAKKKTNYKLRDWVFSRQRYWGEPIPLAFCESCAENLKFQISNCKSKEGSIFSKGEILNPGWVALKESDLPLKLPKVEKYQPTDTGQSPLAHLDKWVNVKCPKCKGKAKRETDVMPNWAGSNWYFLAYVMRGTNGKKRMANNRKYTWNKRAMQYWMPVDWYNGGMEHTTLHLLYSRFIYKFLWDIGVVPKDLGPEPYKKRTSHGMILAEGGVKMSKSKGNVVNPDDVIKQYGADTLRVYEMFMGPFEQAIAWDMNSIKGARRFLDRVFNLKLQISNCKSTSQKLNIIKTLHKTIKKVSEDIEQMKFNTAVSALMECLNEFEKQENITKEDYLLFITLISPFAPHLAEELYFNLKSMAAKDINNPSDSRAQSALISNCKSTSQKSNIREKSKKQKKSIFEEKWPVYDPQIIKEDKISIVVQVNGKTRGTIEAENDISEEKAKCFALKDEKIAKWLANQPIKKVVFVKNRLINFVV